MSTFEGRFSVSRLYSLLAWTTAGVVAATAALEPHSTQTGRWLTGLACAALAILGATMFGEKGEQFWQVRLVLWLAILGYALFRIFAVLHGLT